ncbi:hypothetical protein CYMTET_12557 [Cymbomonas tetramitiformis]|uniref:Uncharacterized protein n=1 Tax=Cymbomonas tetramitiformis TaxID=36881 RepID=A0AAE0LCA5_9CHLO|nr:hypothetical protein CYMTET_12557 [Cymbomonas tetramitiformis]
MSSRDVRKRAPKRGRGGKRLADDDDVGLSRKPKRAHRENTDGAPIGGVHQAECKPLGKSKLLRDVQRKLNDAFDRGDFATEPIDPVAMTLASLQLRKKHARDNIDERVKDYALRVQELKRDLGAAPKYASAALIERVDEKLSDGAKLNVNLCFYLRLMRCEEYAVYERDWKARRKEAPTRASACWAGVEEVQELAKTESEKGCGG